MKKQKTLKSQERFSLIKNIRKLETAIKLNCYDCMGGQKKTDCEIEGCKLYSFRPWAKHRK